MKDLNLDPKSILHNPLINKGSAFTEEERDSLGLHGLLPTHISTIEEQVKRRYLNFCSQTVELGRYMYLAALHDRNETLFYRLVHEHIKEMLPYIYTPTVGEASQHFSYLYHQTRGIYFPYDKQDKIDEILQNIPQKEIDVIVITDGSRILGLGDLGIGGMAIPIGKLALYTLFGGIAPERVLPITIDVGTDNPELLNDPLYLGLSHERITGQKYDAFVDLIVQGIKKRFPHVLLQWEDFSKPHARPLLDRYKDQLCTFNDDIQGTAAVSLAGILAAVKATKKTLSDQRIVIFGGGSAGMGIAELLVKAMSQLGIKDAYDRIFIIDAAGLIHDGLTQIESHHKPFIKKWGSEHKVPLSEVIEKAKPTILIGVSAQTGAFTEDLIRKMASNTAQPIIFPLSNPTSRAEATPENLLKWTKGKAIIATGSPFVPVSYEGKTYTFSQCNNVYIFPGVGLGAILSKSTKITDSMFLKAADILSSQAPILKGEGGGLFPDLTNLRDVTAKIGDAIASIAISEGFGKKSSTSAADYMWFPAYTTYQKKI